jgi:capsular exopolysaccharide synthesis family protein
MRLLGVLPRVKHPVEALDDPTSPLSEAHYSLRASLEQACGGAACKSILFTSSGEGEGKSTAAYGVARNFALSGRRVLLIDADMRRPSIHRYFHIEPAVGLSTILAGLSNARAAIVETNVPGLSIMPSGPIPPSAAALLSGGQFGGMMKSLGKSFDTVIIDAPPVFGLADSPRLAAAVTSTVFIVEAERAKIANARAALRRLLEAKANVVGAVLTKFDVRRASGSSSNLYVYEYGSNEPREQLTAA